MLRFLGKSRPIAAMVWNFSNGTPSANGFGMRRAIYPGSFDPVTNGHIDVIERARKLFDEVIVAVAVNDQKQPLFALEDRLAMLRQAITIEGVRVAPMTGLLVEFAAAQNAHAVIRGLRAFSDFEFEFQMALMNRKLDEKLETIFLMPKDRKSTRLNSSHVSISYAVFCLKKKIKKLKTYD